MEVDSLPKKYAEDQPFNAPNGLMVVGNPLEVTLLDLDEIDKEVKKASAHSLNGLEQKKVQLPLKPVDQQTGSSLVNSLDQGKLYTNISTLLSKYGSSLVLALVDGSETERTIGYGKFKDSLFRFSQYG